jgi:hypothetical protein
LEDAEDYKAFELAVASDYDADGAVERELVLRLASVLWRLRRANVIETVRLATLPTFPLDRLQIRAHALAPSPPARGHARVPAPPKTKAAAPQIPVFRSSRGKCASRCLQSSTSLSSWPQGRPLISVFRQAVVGANKSQHPIDMLLVMPPSRHAMPSGMIGRPGCVFSTKTTCSRR